MIPQEFFAKAVPAAIAAHHLWPGYAVCEAALESAWGESQLAKLWSNLFGQKQGIATANCETVQIPTWEVFLPDHVQRSAPDAFLEPPKLRADGKYNCLVHATWPKFSSWEESFRVRMLTLERLAPKFPHYAAAIIASSGAEFVREVSQTWATDPERGMKVLSIWSHHWSEIEAVSTAVHFPL